MQRPAIQIFNYSLSNKSSEELDVFIDGDIVDAATQEILKNWWGDETSVSYRSFRNQIEEAKPKTLNVYINAPGGHVGDAMAMHDYLNELETKGTTVNRRGRGIIASAATYLLIGKNSEMSQNSFMMIHNVQVIAVGDINEVENQVKAARKFNDRIRDFYATSTNNPPETIATWMNKETWMNAQEAKDRGFVSNITGEASFTNSIQPDAFPFSNKSILNIYNSYTQQNHFSMNKIIEAIEKGFNNALNSLGFKPESPEAQPVINAFRDELTAAFTAELPTNESIQQMIDTSLANYAKKDELPTAVAAPDLTNYVQKSDVANFATKSDLTVVKNEIVTAVTGKTGGESDPDKNPKNKQLRTLGAKNNKYADISYADVAPTN